MKKKLRIGVLVNDLHFLQKWQADCLKMLEGVPEVKLVFSAEPTKRSPPSKNSLFGKVFSRSFLWRIYWKFFHPHSIQNVPFPDVEGDKISLENFRKGIRNGLEDEGLERVRSYEPHLLLRFGWDILTGSILTCTEFGVWSFHHNDPHVFRGGPPAFWEIETSKQVQGAVLQRLSEKLDGGEILAIGHVRTTLHSFPESYENVLALSPLLLRMAIQRTEERDIAIDRIDLSKGEFVTFPGNFRVLSHWAKVFRNKLRFQIKKRSAQEDWTVRVFSKPDALPDGPDQKELTLWGDKRRFFADPFLLPKEQGFLYEEFDSRRKKGVISWSSMDGRHQKVVLEGEEHMSFPFVLHHEGKVLIAPESYNSGKQRLYEWDPEKLELLLWKELDIEACIDATFHYHLGRWWLFCTHPPFSNSVLYIYFSESLEGPYEKHSMCPAKVDVRSSRPAGEWVFLNDGRIMRPTQNNGAYYGSGIRWMEIGTLTPEAFSEHPCADWEPKMMDLQAVGTHTVSFNERYLITDLKTRTGIY
ncbi:MAG: hypothetical protein ABEH38_05285 [Flavobacteriales bacterium]